VGRGLMFLLITNARSVSASVECVFCTLAL